MHTEIRQHLVDAIRMLTRAEIMDYNGHCSLRAGPDRMLINTGRSVRSDLTIADLVEIDMEGKMIDGADAPPNEYHLHTAIYRRRPDVQAIVHGHPRWSTILTTAGERPKVVYAQGALLGDVKVFGNPLSVNTREMGDALAATLGDERAVLLQSHGCVTVGADIVEAFALALYLEDNAQRHYMARQIGQPYVFTDEEQAACKRNLWKPNLFKKAWDHHAAQIHAVS